MEEFKEFEEFGSIPNVDRLHPTHVEQIEKQSDDILVTEKVHGCNFSIHKNGTDLQYAKRTAILNVGDNLFGWQRLRGGLQKLVNNLQDVTGFKTCRIDGELFGGCTEDQKDDPVQDTIIYDIKKHFIVFDLTLDGKYVPFIKAVPLLNKAGFLTVPILAQYPSFKEAIKHNNKFVTTIPSMLGLPDPTHEKFKWCEGIVIRSERPDGRFLAKSKNEHHYEIEGVIRKPRSEKSTDRHNVDEFIPMIYSKVENMRSRGPQNEAEFRKLMLEDVLKDIQDDLSKPKKGQLARLIMKDLEFDLSWMPKSSD